MKRPLKILVLEDSPDDVTLIAWILEKAGLSHSLQTVTERSEFERALKEYVPDVILADHFLPNFNSIEAFQLFKEHQEAAGVSTPFILVTGNVSEEFAVQSMKAGVDDYILKDRLKRLPLSIESALEKCRLQNERRKYLAQVIAKEGLMNEAEQLAQFGSWESDLRTGRHRWSDATYSLYGFEPGEIEPDYDTFLNSVHPDDLSSLNALVDEALKSRDDIEAEFRIIDHRGVLKYLHCKLKIHRDAEGKAIRLVGFNRDISQSKQAALALQKSEQQYRSLFHQSPHVVFSLDLQGRFTNVNSAFINLVGYTREQMLGTDFQQVLVESELKKVYSHFVSALGRAPQRYETTFVNRLGKKFILDVTLMSIVVDDQIVGVHCIAIDITEKERLQKRLDQSYHAARIGAWEFDMIGNKFSWTGVTRELHEVPADYTPTFESAFLFYEAGRSRETIRAALKRCIGEDVPWELELKIITGEGRERWVHTTGQGEWEEGRCVRLYGTVQDIHERKTFERISRRAFEEKVNIFESMGDGFIATNQSATVTYWNRMAERLLGVPRKEVLGMCLWDVYGTAISRRFREEYQRAMSDQVAVHFVEHHAEANLWLEVNIYPSEGGLSIYFKDITRQEQQMREIAAQSQQLAEIARIQSHDIGAPLARIIGLVNLLDDRMDRDSELPELLRIIKDNATELDRIVRGIVRNAEGQLPDPSWFSERLSSDR